LSHLLCQTRIGLDFCYTFGGGRLAVWSSLRKRTTAKYKCLPASNEKMPTNHSVFEVVAATKEICAINTES